MTDSTTPNYGWSYPTVGADSNTWGTTLNNTIIAIDALLGSGTLSGLAKVGIGMSPTNILDITQNQNAVSTISILNSSGGIATEARVQAFNGTHAIYFRQLGESFTRSGALVAGYGILEADSGLTISSAALPIIFAKGSVECARFDTSKNFHLNETAGWSTARFSVSDTSQDCASFYNASANRCTLFRLDSSSGKYAEFFYGASTSVGSITTNTTNTAYNTSSDARLKERITDAGDPGPIIDQLRVRQWDWRATGAHEAWGFVAQEEAQVAPFAVTVGDDDPENVTKTWQRDDAKLVPLMLKEIQLLRARLAKAGVP